MNKSYLCVMNPGNNKKPIAGFVHAVAWAILFGMPFFFTGREQSVTVESYLRFVIVPLSFMMVFYANYFLLVDKFLFTRQAGKYVLSNLALIAVAMAGVHFLMQLLPPPQGMHHRPERSLQDIILFFTGNTLLYSLVAGLSVAIRMTGSWYKVEGERKELEKSNFEAELKNLKSQLNPHFLFNTLNNIYSLIAFSPEKAQQSVHDLSKLLRYVLYENNQHFVPLAKELDFLRNYIRLMRLRLPAHVEVKAELSETGSPEMLIAPLLFISLIENAFKHGVSTGEPSFIYIAIHIGDDRKITCTIQNSYFPKNGHDKSGSGIGLANLRKRLELLYPERYVLRCERAGDTYLSGLVLYLKPDHV